MIKKIYWKLYKLFYGEKAAKRAQHRKIIQSVQENGKEAFHLFASLVVKHNCTYSLCYGTLLGAVRDKGLIPHDEDMDIIMDTNHISSLFVDDMINRGFELIRAFIPNHGKTCHLAFRYKNMKFDIYPYTIDEIKGELSIYCPSPLNNKWKDSSVEGKAIFVTRTIPYKGFKKIPFLGIEASIPQNEDEVLKVLYGDSYMIPIYDFKGTQTGIRRYNMEENYFKIGNLDDFKMLYIENN